MKTSRGFIGTALGILVSALLLGAPVAEADIVVDANARASEAASRLPGPPPAVRTMAIVQVSVFEAVNAVSGRYPSRRAKLPPATFVQSMPPPPSSVSDPSPPYSQSLCAVP